jgi:hypothetical protein
VDRVLKLSSNNWKLGSHFSKGDWVGLPIFSLRLPQQTNARQVAGCYGNRMTVAPRLAVDVALYGKLTVEIENLALMFTGGFALRLHELAELPDAESGAAGSHLRSCPLWSRTTRRGAATTRASLARPMLNTQR